jgi:flagellar biosynthesis regulator FlbT
MENGQRIRRFLLNHPQVMRVLAEAQDYVTEYFGADAEVVLEVVEDPDVAQRKKLLARVVTEKPMEEAFSQLQAFGRDWFTSEFARVDGLINFDVACV